MYQWCEFKSRRGTNKNMTAQRSNFNTVRFNFQTYIYICVCVVFLPLTQSRFILCKALFNMLCLLFLFFVFLNVPFRTFEQYIYIKGEGYPVLEYLCIFQLASIPNMIYLIYVWMQANYIVSSRWLNVWSRQFSILLRHLNKHHGEFFYLDGRRYLYSVIFREIMNHNYVPLVIKYTDRFIRR